jgi:hypothetical protein
MLARFFVSIEKKSGGYNSTLQNMRMIIETIYGISCHNGKLCVRILTYRC